jgi:hypothetical protein
MDAMLLENRLAVPSQTVGAAAYDFDFGLYFGATHPYRFAPDTPAVLRIGAVPDYARTFDEHAQWNLRLVNTPEEHERASELAAWYPLIDALTPRTRVFDALPPADAIEAEFRWPVFIKGSRQTSRHNPDLAIVRSREHYEEVRVRYAADPILAWQKPAVREFVPLAPVGGSVPGKVRPSLEFRTFWWRGDCVGAGPYWYQVPRYTAADLDDGLALAAIAARRVAVPFLVVDIARTAEGRWIVIECNDAQESGHAGIVPQVLWRNVLDRISEAGAVG